MREHPRLDELRRRVERDPASIAFAQLAEEHRRAGQCEDAVRVCRAGLLIHPGYLSARVTLARALVELDALDEALEQFTLVIKAAPENLVAVRSVADIYYRQDQLAEALGYYQSALNLARNDPDLQQIVGDLTARLNRPARTVPPPDRTRDRLDDTIHQLQAWLDVIVNQQAP